MATLSGTLNGDSILGTEEDDEISGLGGNDRLFGNGGNDLLIGGDGSDVLKGGDGDDRLEGGASYDRLFGQAGNDVIIGGAGNDWIQGMAGADVLTGGPGADGFFFASLDDAGDVITDFSPEEGDGFSFIGELDGAEALVDETSVSVRPAGAQSFTEMATFGDGQQTSDNDPPAVDDDPVENDDTVGKDEPVNDGNEQTDGNDPSTGGGDGPIDVWYGDTQTFGDPGVPQRWVNILGNVETEGLNSLTWSLNGGPAQNLSFPTGSGNFSRLANQGDFNVELDYSELDPSPTDDVVTIRAAYGNGDVFERDVTIDHEGGQEWPTTYSIDWSQVSDLQDVVQVVDGKWSFDESGVRPAEIGYDRVVAIGDQSWDSYEARFSIQMNELDSPAVNGEAIWLGMQWGGHTDDPIPNQTPHAGYIPGATFMLNSGTVQLRPSEFEPRDVDGDGVLDNPRTGSGARFENGQTYEFLIRNERDPNDNDLSDGLDRTYGIKVWRAGDPEPDNFLIQETMINQEPFGSFYFATHFTDATLGDIEFTPLPLDAVVQGDDSLDSLLAANSESSATTTTQSASDPSEAAAPGVAMADLLASGDETALAA